MGGWGGAGGDATKTPTAWDHLPVDRPTRQPTLRLSRCASAKIQTQATPGAIWRSRRASGGAWEASECSDGLDGSDGWFPGREGG